MLKLLGWLKARKALRKSRYQSIGTGERAQYTERDPYGQQRQSVAAAIERFKYYIQIRDEKSDREASREKYWNRITTVIVTFAGAATVAAAIFTGLSLKYAYETVDASREGVRQAGLQTQAAQAQITIAQAGSRPYIFVQINKERIVEGGMATEPYGTGAGGYAASYKVVNFGTTPAVIKEIDSEITIDFQRTDQYKQERHITDMIIGQSQDGIQRSVGLPTLSNEALSLIKGGAKLYISLRVAYTDTIGNNLYTHICYKQPFANRVDYDVSLKIASGPNCDNDRN